MTDEQNTPVDCSCGLSFANRERFSMHVLSHGIQSRHVRVTLPPVIETDLGFLPNWINQYEKIVR